MHRDIDANDYSLLLELEDVKVAHKGATELEISMLPTFCFGMDAKKRRVPSTSTSDTPAAKKQKGSRKSNPIVIDLDEVIEIDLDEVNVDDHSSSSLIFSSSSSSSSSSVSAASCHKAPLSNTVTDDTENKKCCICLMEYEVGDEMMRLPCLHAFHRDCLVPWLVNNCTCPIDKLEVRF